MKKLLGFILLLAIFTSCGEDLPQSYDFYNGFEKTAAAPVIAVGIEGYKDITITENTPVLKDELELDNLFDHKINGTKKAVVADFYFDSYADHRQIEKAREYAFETFWLGKVHTAHMLPYEDWQYSYLIKELTVQIYNNDSIAISDTYIFDQLTDSGDKLYTKSSVENVDNVFLGSYIYLGDLLKGTREQLETYTNIDSTAGIPVYTSIRQDIAKTTLYVTLTTEENQINPQKLNDVYDAVYERYSFINENIVIQLYTADGNLYYEYSGHIELPAEE